MKLNTLYLLLFSIVLFSCKPEVRKVDLFDMLKLVENQRSYFEENPAKALRISELNATRDTLQLDSFRWKSEFEVFKSFDLNNTRYKTDYLETIETQDGNRVLSYSLDLPEEDFTGIYTFSVTYQGQTDSPAKIMVQELANNLVYNSANNYVLEFKNTSDGTVLNRVTVNGKQDLMMKDPISYRVSTELLP